MPRSDNRKALQQLTVLGVLVALVTGVAGWASTRPDREAELRVVLQELEAQAAELEALRAASPADVPARFRSRHERQLQQDFERTSHELATLDVIPELRLRQQQILATDRKLNALFALPPTVAGPADSQSRLTGLRQELRSQETALSR